MPSNETEQAISFGAFLINRKSHLYYGAWGGGGNADVVPSVTVDDRCQRCERMLQGDAVRIYVTVDVRCVSVVGGCYKYTDSVIMSVTVGDRCVSVAGGCCKEMHHNVCDR